MDYCLFQNTLMELSRCHHKLEEHEELDGDEAKAAKVLIELAGRIGSPTYQDHVDKAASMLADESRCEAAWHLRGACDAIAERPIAEGTREAGPYARPYVRGYRGWSPGPDSAPPSVDGAKVRGAGGR